MNNNNYVELKTMLDNCYAKYHTYETRINETNFKVISVSSQICPHDSLEFKFFADTGELYVIT